jgi:quercetin dioxygenase-like cupin family protein
VEILRFGPGFRRTEPLGAHGVAAQTFWSDARARITELAFSRRALLAPQTSPSHGLFIVISGGGWVQVGDERSAINHGEAVDWPPGLRHAAWTDGSAMRALLVELPDTTVEGRAARLAASAGVEGPPPWEPELAARGHLADRGARPEDHDPAEGEPW